MNNRIAILKAMDTIMRNAEDAYEFIASKDELYFGVADDFRVLISAYSHRIFGRTTK